MKANCHEQSEKGLEFYILNVKEQSQDMGAQQRAWTSVRALCLALDTHLPLQRAQPQGEMTATTPTRMLRRGHM